MILDRKNWTQADLADKIGVSRQSVNSIETGRLVPSTDLALKMAKVFGTKVEVVFQLRKLTDAKLCMANKVEVVSCRKQDG
ncbi:MAG: helix-turn-helix transcriptional regulator [Saprospiraceae bacterium]